MSRCLQLHYLKLFTFMLKLSHRQFAGYDDKISLGEVQFFFCTKVGDEELPFALISLFTAPDTTLLARSHGTLWSSRYQGEAKLRVIPVKSITPPFRCGVKLTFRVQCHTSSAPMSADIHWMPAGHQNIKLLDHQWPKCPQDICNDMLLVSQVHISLWWQSDNWIIFIFILLYTGCLQTFDDAVQHI